MKAEPLDKGKRVLWNPQTEIFAVAELKIWRISMSKDYPKGIRV